MLQPTGMAVLDALRLGEAGAIRSSVCSAPRAVRLVLDVRYRALGRGAGCGLGGPRAALFQVLHEAALAEGVTLETGREAVGSQAAGAGRPLGLG